MKRHLAFLITVLLCGCQTAADKADNNIVTRPTFQLATAESYDLGSIAPYAGDHARVYDYIDTNLSDHVAAIQRWLRQPAIS